MAKETEVLLEPVREKTSFYDDIEALIIEVLKKHLYLPVAKAAKTSPSKLKKNQKPDALLDALVSGSVSYKDGVFKGEFNAAMGKVLREMGAKWDAQSAVYKIAEKDVPFAVRSAIAIGRTRIDVTSQAIMKELAKISPEQVASKVIAQKMFSETLWTIDTEISQAVRKISIPAKLTLKERSEISEGYNKNLQKYVKDFTEEQIIKMREQVMDATIKGGRFESLVEPIMKSFQTSHAKAKFLARQETSLMMAAFKKARYQSAGLNEYIWTCVVGSPAHPVRPMHEALNGKKFTWDNPPVTAPNGARNNPGEDFGCRCFPRVIAKFSEKNS